MKRRCQRCGRDRTDTATICHQCARDLKRTLQHIARLWPHLQEAIGKRTAMGAKSGNKPTKASEQPLPVDMHASQVADCARGVLVGWCRVLCEDNRLTPPADTVPAICGWLRDHMGVLRMHEAADVAADEITRASRDITRAVDHPIEKSRVYTGHCPEDVGSGPYPGDACPGEIWAVIPASDIAKPYMECRPPRADHTATVCGNVWDATRWLRLGVRIKRREAQIETQKSYGRTA